jgi:hypothetical protein
MGTTQLLLIVLGVVIVGVGIAVGIGMFGATSIDSNRSAIVEDLQNIAVDAYSFKTRPTTMGGGSGQYSGYSVPAKLGSNDDGNFVAAPVSQSMTLTATSALGYGTVSAVLDSIGQLGHYDYSGEFRRN